MGQTDTPLLLSGLDHLIRGEFEPLSQKKVALFCNHSSVSITGEHVLDILSMSSVTVQKAIIFRQNAYDTLWVDPSLFTLPAGDNILYLRWPNLEIKPSDFKGCDFILFDMQLSGFSDDPVISMLRIAMKVSERLQLPLIILDRPNYFSSVQPRAPMRLSLRIPYVYGLSTGELALYFTENEKLIDPDRLKIIKMINYRHALSPDEYPQLCIQASPYISTEIRWRDQPLVYLLNMTNMEGTIHPQFRQYMIFADFMDAAAMKNALIKENPVFNNMNVYTFMKDDQPVNALEYSEVREMESYDILFHILRLAAVLYPNELYISSEKWEKAFGDLELYRMLVVDHRPTKHLIHYYDGDLMDFQIAVKKLDLYE